MLFCSPTLCLRVCVCAVKCRAQLHGDVSSEVMAASVWCFLDVNSPTGFMPEWGRHPQIAEEKYRKEFVVLSAGVKGPILMHADPTLLFPFFCYLYYGHHSFVVTSLHDCG